MASYGNSSGFKKLIRLMARAFYAGPCPPKFADVGDDDGAGGGGGTVGGLPGGPPRPKKQAQVDTNHLGIVVLDALTRCGGRRVQRRRRRPRSAPALAHLSPTRGGPSLTLRHPNPKPCVHTLRLLPPLLRREWVDEVDLAAELGLHHKQARRALRFLEGEQLVMAEHIRLQKRRLARDAIGIATGASSPPAALLLAPAARRPPPSLSPSLAPSAAAPSST